MELTFDKRMSDRWSARASYTLSRLYGNYPGLSQTDENGRTSPNVGRSFDYPLMAFDGNGERGARPPADGSSAPVQGAGELRDATGARSIGANEYIASGIPVTREAAAISPSNFPIQYLGRLSDGRTPTISQTDFTVSHSFRFGVAEPRAGHGHHQPVRSEDGDQQVHDAAAERRRSSSSEADFYAGKVDFLAAANAARPGSALPAGERLPAAAHHSLQRPVLVLEPDRETGSTAGPGFLWSRVRFPGRATLRGWRGPFTYRLAALHVGAASARRPHERP